MANLGLGRYNSAGVTVGDQKTEELQLDVNGNLKVTTTGSSGDSAVLADDAAFTPGTSNVDAVGFFADETAADSVTEGDIGAARMTLDRRQITASQTTDDAAPETGTRVNMIGAIADETGSDSVDEGDAGWLRMTLTRFLKTSLGDLLSGEDQTNSVIAMVEKPLAVSTYCPDLDTSAALEASSVTKASPGVLYGFSASNTNATGHWIQFFNSTTLPADTTVPVLEFQIGAEGTISAEWPRGRAFSTGIVWCISSTNGAKTIAGATALVDVSYK